MPMEFPGKLGGEKGDSEAGREESDAVEVTSEETTRSSSLRGKLMEGLRERQKDDEERSSLLRGTLLKKIAESSDEETPATPKLKGTLLNTIKAEYSDKEDALPGAVKSEEVPEPSRLRGKLMERETHAVEPFSKEWLKKQTFIQRDGKAEYVFHSFNQGLNTELIRLVCAENGAFISLGIERLIQRLKTRGEAWSVKQE